MHERWDDVVVQHYVDGREVNVGIVRTRFSDRGNYFGEMPRGMWRSSSISRSGSRQRGRPRCEAVVHGRSSRQPRKRAETDRHHRGRAVGGTVYGRVDFRIDAEGKPWILEVNPNPDIALMRASRGWREWPNGYPALIKRICVAGLKQKIDSNPELGSGSLHLSGMSGCSRAGQWISHRRGHRPRHGRRRIFVGDMTMKYRESVRDILIATRVFRDEEIQVQLSLFDIVSVGLQERMVALPAGSMNSMNAQPARYSSSALHPG